MSQTPDHDEPAALAIIGIGCMFPKAGNLSAYWSNIREGVDAITDVPASHWRPDDYFNADRNAPDMTYARRGGFIDPVPFDPLYYGISPNNIEATDTTQLLGMVAARAALLDAGYATGKDSQDGRSFDRDRTSVILGVTGTLELVIPLGARLGHPLWRRALRDAGVADATAEEVVKRIAAGYVPWQENSFPGLLGNVAAGRIANRFDLGGTNCVVDAACASSLSAIHMASMELQSGRCDMAISGGIDTFNDIFMYMCFSKTPALSPTGNSRPFHINGDGTILGEGIGVVILKRLADAERDTDRIYAVIKGIGASSDGKGNAIYAPSATGQQKALHNAYRITGVAPGTIELVEAHGTGTRVGDAVEAAALSAVYREDRPQGSWCALGSVKSMIGHTKAAAGVAGLIKVAMALQHKVLPPTIKVEQPLEILQPGTAPVYVNTVKRPWPSRAEHPRRAAVSAFGFGGSNFHAVLEEVETGKRFIEWDGQVLIHACSGADVPALREQLTVIEEYQGDWTQLRRAAARSLKDYDPGLEHRLILVIDRERTDIRNLLQAARDLLADQSRVHRSTPDGAFYGEGKAPGGMAFLFPGQGAQYPGMLRDLACQFPQLLTELETANATLGDDADGCRLSDRIYPIPVFDQVAADAHKATLTATVTAQPAIAAISAGVVRILDHFGIQADACAGHSFGELTALHYAGWFTDSDLLRLARKRGELMQQGDGDRGAMLAVLAAPEQLHPLIEEQQLDLIIANHNAPAQLVLSGASAQIDKAEAVLRQRKIRSSRLPVAAAFHSSFVAGAEKPFAEFINDIEFTPGRIPVYSNTTAKVYSDDPERARALLAGQLARPVEFVREIENLYAAGIRTFIEAGPSNIITGLIGRILAEREHHAFAVDASKGQRSGQYDLALLLARLSTLGYHCDLDRWDAGYLASLRDEKQPALTIPLSGANYVQPRAKNEVIITPEAVVQQPAKATPVPVPATTAPQPGATAPAQDAGGAAALQAIQQGILALQQLQEQTAQLHKQFLKGQEHAQHTIQQLLLQQQQLITGVPVSAVALPVPPAVQIEKPAVVAQTQPAVPATSAAAQPRTTEKDLPVKSNTQYKNILLEVVAEKTGYPVDMLSLDMSLDTDLGIDSIKRVEILAALQEKLPGIQKIQPEDLGTFQLLQHIVEYLADGDRTTSVIAEAARARPAQPVPFQQVLLEVVAAKTGYPVDMLNLDMNLDSDLGIDSIKRVEILAAFQERLPEAPAVQPDELGRLQTLRQIVEYMGEGAVSATTLAVPAVTGNHELMQQTLLEVVAARTGYPVDMLNPDMNLDSDLGIDSIKRVEILAAFQERVPDAPVVQPDQLGQLQTLRQIVAYMQVDAAVPASKTPAPAAKVTPESEPEIKVQELYQGSVVLTPLDDGRPVLDLPAGSKVLVTSDGTELPSRICELLNQRQLSAAVLAADTALPVDVTALIIMVPAQCDDAFIKRTFTLIQQAGRQGIKALAGVTRLGGSFGFENLADASPVAAAIHGIIKTADKEWPAVACKVIDITVDSEQSAACIVAELLTRGPLEVGITDQGCLGLSLSPLSLTDQTAGRPPLHPGDVVVISGGARGVTAEVALALAQSWHTKLVLLGRSPEPVPEPDWLARLRTEAEIKQALINRQTGTERLTPKAIQEEFQRLNANRELLTNLERLRATGVMVSYHAIDVRDARQVAACLAQARRDTGPIRGIIHGAGVLADRYITDKTPEQFDQVYSTKVDGLRALLQATSADELKLLVLFSSSTARYGRKGQADYAAANEVLNKMARQQQQLRPGCRVLSVNWGPWAGGMVTASLQKVFAGEGVGLIPVQAGAQYLLRACAANGPVEVVVLGSAPLLPGSAAAGFNETMQVAFERNLNVADYPVLQSHIMNGRAVLPAALITEWLAHGAMHHNLGLVFTGFEDFRIYKGVILEPGANLTLQILSGAASRTGNRESIPVELRSGNVLHARTRIILSNGYDQPATSSEPQPDGVSPYRDNEYYRNGQLFHGRDLQGLQTVTACSARCISGESLTAPAPLHWMKNPIRSSWLADPLVIDGCFQLLILWSFQHAGAGSLPTAIAGYRQYQRSYPKDGVRIIARIKHSTQHQAIADIEIQDKHGKPVARLDGYECVIDGSLNAAFKKNQAADILD